MTKYYDLRVDLNSGSEWGEVLKALERAKYDGIAVNQTFIGRVPEGGGMPAEWIDMLRKETGLRVYTRVTVVMDAPNGSVGREDRADILAVMPVSEKALHLACTQMEVDIISLPIHEKIPFYLKFTTLNAAIQRGIYFELCFKEALKDTAARRNALYNASQVIMITKGKNILASSGAGTALDVRSPHDFMNLVGCLGLGAQMASHVTSDNAKHVLYHAATRKHTYRGVVSILKETDRSDSLYEDFIRLE